MGIRSPAFPLFAAPSSSHPLRRTLSSCPQLSRRIFACLTDVLLARPSSYHLSLPLLLCCSYSTRPDDNFSSRIAMPSTWRDDHHTAFLTERVPAYHQSGRNLTRKQFWEDTAKAWFERFPLDEPSAQLIAEAGTKEKAMERARQSKIKVGEACDRLSST